MSEYLKVIIAPMMYTWASPFRESPFGASIFSQEVVLGVFSPERAKELVQDLSYCRTKTEPATEDEYAKEALKQHVSEEPTREQISGPVFLTSQMHEPFDKGPFALNGLSDKDFDASVIFGCLIWKSLCEGDQRWTFIRQEDHLVYVPLGKVPNGKSFMASILKRWLVRGVEE